MNRSLRIATVITLFALACGTPTGPDLPGAFRFQASATGSILVVQISSAAIRDTAKSLWQSHTQRWVVGNIRPGSGGINSPWGWHLDPASIAFPEVTIEACQATPEYIEETLEYWITFGQVCILGYVITPAE